MAITGKCQVSELDYGDKEFAEIVEQVVKYVNQGSEVHQGNDQLDTDMVLLELMQDNPERLNEEMTFVIRGIRRPDFEEWFDEKLWEMAEDLVRSYKEENHG